MAHTISALRQHKQSEERRRRNHAVKSALRTQIRKVLATVEKKDAPASQAAFSTASKLLDRASAKGVIHHNNGTKPEYQLPDSLVQHVESAIAACSPNGGKVKVGA